jgi:hypothetical protein
MSANQRQLYASELLCGGLVIGNQSYAYFYLMFFYVHDFAMLLISCLFLFGLDFYYCFILFTVRDLRCVWLKRLQSTRYTNILTPRIDVASVE